MSPRISRQNTTMNNSMERYLAYGCLATSMALVGSYVALSKPLLAVFPVFLLAWLRFGVGAVAMTRWIKRPYTEPPLTRKTKFLLFLESFLGNFLFSVFMLYGMKLTSAVAAGIIMSTIPAAVALLSWAFLKEKVGWKNWTAIACAALGIALYSFTKQEQTIDTGYAIIANETLNHEWLGNLFILAAVLCEAAYAVIGKKLTDGLTPKRISSIINLWGLVLVTPLGLWVALSFDFRTVTAPNWVLLVFYGLAASVWTVWLWMTGLKSVPAGQAGVFTVMLPISAGATGVLFLGETLSVVQGLAFCVALGGVALATLPERASKPPAHPL